MIVELASDRFEKIAVKKVAKRQGVTRNMEPRYAR